MSAQYSFSQQDIYDYVNLWKDCTVSLQQWIKFRSVGIRSELAGLGLTKQQYTNIHKHQVRLFHEQVNISFIQQFRDPFDRIQGSEEKQHIALRDLKLIECITEETVTAFQRESIRKILDVSFRKKTAIQMELILRNKFESSDNYSIHHPDNYLKASVLLRYKAHLKKYLRIHDSISSIDAQTEKFNSMGGISETLPANLKNFFIAANPMNSAYAFSCCEYLMHMDELFENLMTDLAQTYDDTEQNNRNTIVKCLSRKIIEFRDACQDNKSDQAYKILDHNDTDIFSIVETIMTSNDIDTNSFPGYLKLNPEDILNNPALNDHEIDTHKSFVSLISGHFLAELIKHIKSPGAALKSLQNEQEQPYIISEFKPLNVTAESATKYRNNSFSLASGNNKLNRLRKLYTYLKKNKFIADDTDLNHFRAVFENEVPVHKITWTGNISELSYFIKLMHSEKAVILKIHPSIWQVVNEIFIDANGKPFGWKRFRKQSVPATADLLETAVWNLA